MQTAFLLCRCLRRCIAFDGVLLAVRSMPFGEQVILDPDDFANGSDNRYLPFQLELYMRKNGLQYCVLDVAQTGAEEDVVDVERVSSSVRLVVSTGSLNPAVLTASNLEAQADRYDIRSRDSLWSDSTYP